MFSKNTCMRVKHFYVFLWDLGDRILPFCVRKDIAYVKQYSWLLTVFVSRVEYWVR